MEEKSGQEMAGRNARGNLGEYSGRKLGKAARSQSRAWAAGELQRIHANLGDENVQVEHNDLNSGGRPLFDLRTAGTV